MTTLLTPQEMASLDRALAKRTGGSIRVGGQAMSVAQGIAIWNATACFEREPARPPSGIGALLPRSGDRDARVGDGAALRRALGVGAGLAAAASLAGCATFGGNVKGSFACRAPDGICAPTSTIDDAALALISGDPSVSPAGPFMAPRPASPHMTPIAAREPVRSGEKVLRIVFPAHIDAAGRFREATAIHAVVERGDWIAAADAVPVLQRAAMRQAPPVADLALAEPSPEMPTLGELAAAAPEVQFPGPVADIDAQNAAETAPPPAPHAGKVGQRRARHVSRSARATGARQAAQAAKPVAEPPLVSSTARGGAQPSAAAVAGSADPVAGIRAQVAKRLNASSRRSAQSGSAGASVTQIPGTSVSAVRYSLPAGIAATGAIVAVGAARSQQSSAPAANASSGVPSSGTAEAVPVNGPGIFPASDVHP